MKFIPRIVGSYGMIAHPIENGVTCLESECLCTYHGKFERKGVVRHKISQELIRVRADVADTWFSIPATTATEHGFIVVKDDRSDNKELTFIPHTDQLKETPAQYRSRIRKAYK